MVGRAERERSFDFAIMNSTTVKTRNDIVVTFHCCSGTG